MLGWEQRPAGFGSFFLKRGPEVLGSKSRTMLSTPGLHGNAPASQVLGFRLFGGHPSTAGLSQKVSP